MPPAPFDRIDWNILAALQEDGRISNVALADKVHLTPSPCLARVKALEDAGIISRYLALKRSPSRQFRLVVAMNLVTPVWQFPAGVVTSQVPLT